MRGDPRLLAPIQSGHQLLGNGVIVAERRVLQLLQDKGIQFRFERHRGGFERRQPLAGSSQFGRICRDSGHRLRGLRVAQASRLRGISGCEFVRL